MKFFLIFIIVMVAGGDKLKGMAKMLGRQNRSVCSPWSQDVLAWEFLEDV